MSWAEVKKINSNLAKPLDELLTDSESGLSAIKNAIDKPARAYLLKSKTAVPTTSSPLTLSINGAGKIHGIFMMFPGSTNTMKLTLKADEVSVMNYTLQGGEGRSGTYYKMLVSRPELIAFFPNSPYHYFGMLMTEFSESGNFQMDYRYTVFNVPIFKTVTEENSSSQRFSLIDNPIKFTTNFTGKIEAINGDFQKGAFLFFLYTLD